MARARVVGLDEDQTGLEAGDIQCKHSGGAKIERPSGRHQGIPHLDRTVCIHPQLVAEIARVARPGNVDGGSTDARRTPPEIAQVGERLARCRLENVPRERADEVANKLKEAGADVEIK